MPPLDFRGHVRPELVGIVRGFLLRRKPFVVQVLAQARADLERRPEARPRVLDRETDD